MSRPKTRPQCPHFSSGPTAKRPGFSFSHLQGALVGRSHRHPDSISAIHEVFGLTRELLALPDDYLLAIVPGSDTGAFEMALWNLIGGDRIVSCLYWESFGEGWANDLSRLVDPGVLRMHSAPYGFIPNLDNVDWSTDVVFTLNGTTSGVQMPLDELLRRIASDRENLIISDITSAAFALPITWAVLDVATFSWQKALGGEAAHGMIVLSPRAVRRLEASPPKRPLPKVFRLLDDTNRLNRALFDGSVINTISMLCLEDWRQSLLWAQSLGRDELIARAQRNVAALGQAVNRYRWLTWVASEPRLISPCGCTLGISDMTQEQIRQMIDILASEGVAFDIASYRAAPPGIRVWCGCTVEESDVAALVPWVGWAHDRVLHPPAPHIRRSKSMHKVLVADGLDPGALRKLQDAGIEPVQASIAQSASSGDLKNYAALCVRSATQVTDDVLDAFGGALKVVARAGVGVDNIDVRAASQRGVAVVNAPTAATIAAAELTVGHALSILRRIGMADRAAHTGQWIKSQLIGRELHDRRIGVIGFGRIGSMVAERFRDFGAHVIGYDPWPGAVKYARSHGFEVADSVDELLPQVSLITLHIPLTEGTRHLIDARRIALMPPGSFIVNSARGGLVEEMALLDALNSGHIAGAASDVFEVEPFQWDNEGTRALLQHCNFLATPHVGAQTVEAQKRVGEETAAAIIKSLDADEEE